MYRHRVITVTENGASNSATTLDGITSKLNQEGWNVLQINTCFGDRALNSSGTHFPTLFITLLVEKED